MGWLLELDAAHRLVLYSTGSNKVLNGNEVIIYSTGDKFVYDTAEIFGREYSVVAGIHVAMAFPLISRLLRLFNMTDVPLQGHIIRL